MSSTLPKLVKAAKYGTLTVFCASMTSAWYYRPVADDSPGYTSYDDDDCNDHHLHQRQHRQLPTPPPDHLEKQMSTSLGPDRTTQTFCSPHTSPPWSRPHAPLLLSWARGISIGATTLAIRLFMNTYGTYDIVDDEHYRYFLETVISGVGHNASSARNINHGSQHHQGLITVSNHRSLFDDPGVLSCLLPLPLAIQPKYNRWGICSQEYCFNDALPGLVKGYIGAGQVLPICRGGGINQKLLLDFARHLACGEWCHVFPEGGVWQWDEVGGRRDLPEGSVLRLSSDFAKRDDVSSDDGVTMTATIRNTTTTTTKDDNNDARNADADATNKIIIPATKVHKSLKPSPKGKLKWGVGKLIAHAPIAPKVIPFAHCGMETLLPQDEMTGKTKLRKNIFGGFSFFGSRGGHNDEEEEDNERLRVRIQFGPEITFDDLITKHEAKYGKLWKYSGKVTPEEELETGRSRGEFHKYWDSSKEERELYSQIAKRIEERMEVLTKEVHEGRWGKQ